MLPYIDLVPHMLAGEPLPAARHREEFARLPVTTAKRPRKESARREPDHRTRVQADAASYISSF